ncbi:MAG: hypothetical protein A2V70_15660 [Planctomycetes bacterium RBG_13_63_9]|nr:MAG: hypothetical protein A2V70_15660 [Planctomycetes bacterium RBG_13_63_9]
MCRSVNRSAAVVLATLGVISFCAVIVRTVAAQIPGQALVDREHAIKAVYVLKFAGYVTWPEGAFPDAESPLVIGSIGANPIDPYLDRIASRQKVAGRPIVVRRFETVQQYQPCQILFVGRLVDPEHQQAVLQRLGNAPVLSVGEMPGFAERGGVINFYIAGNKVRFEINRTVAEAKDLKISSKLLALAKIVGGSDATSLRARDGLPAPRPQ